jgi:hypothetical protein
MFPKILDNELEVQNNKLTLQMIDYEVLKNRIGDEGRFGFHIDYNKTAAELDKKSDDGEDDSGGFLPGFESFYLILILIFICIGKNLGKKRKH